MKAHIMKKNGQGLLQKKKWLYQTGVECKIFWKDKK